MLASMTVNAPVALRLAMEAVNAGLDSTLADGCALEGALFGLCAATQDRTKGTAAFLAKRKPQLAALHERACADAVTIDPHHAYVDEGRSGASLTRPALPWRRAKSIGSMCTHPIG
jgi:hypothetical protein